MWLYAGLGFERNGELSSVDHQDCFYIWSYCYEEVCISRVGCLCNVFGYERHCRRAKVERTRAWVHDDYFPIPGFDHSRPRRNRLGKFDCHGYPTRSRCNIVQRLHCYWQKSRWRRQCFGCGCFRGSYSLCWRTFGRWRILIADLLQLAGDHF